MRKSYPVRYILDVDRDTIKVHDLHNRREACYVEEIISYITLDLSNEADLSNWLRKNIKRVSVCKHCLESSQFAQVDHYKEHLAKNHR